MHGLLNELAADRDVRWTKTQILYYLPSGFHRAASEYFEGERVVRRARQPIQLVEPDVGELAAALDRIRASGSAKEMDGAGASEVYSDPPPLSELRADPPEDGNDVIGNVLDALLAEAHCVDGELPKRFRLSGGRCVGPQGDTYVYVFRWSSEPELFMPGELLIGKTVIAARVGRQADGERRFELIASEFLGAHVDSAVFRVDPTFLHRVQFQRLDALRDVYPTNALAKTLFATPDPLRVGTGSADSGLNERQNYAVRAVIDSKRSYVWGPPGTGKTTTLGRLLSHLNKSNKRILVLSPYNVAVDEAVLSAWRQGDFTDESMVRFGRSSARTRSAGLDLDSLLERRAERSGILTAARILHASFYKQYVPGLRATPSSVRGCMEELGELVIRLHENKSSADPVKRALKELRTLFRAPEQDILRGARVIGTTVSLFLLSSKIEPASFDYVLVDEASVLRMPEALLVALRAVGHVSFFGDPKQLPPIVRLKTPQTLKWLKPNPFDMASISRPSDAKGSCVLLNEQHRMSPPVRGIVSDCFYEGQLVDGQCPGDGRLVLVDTSETPARATTRWVRLSQSKENLVHRGIVSRCLAAIRAGHPDSPILVLSPYLAQKKAYVHEANTNRIEGVQYGTVHASQGRESDIVLIDLVLAPGRGKSRFMNERVTPEFRNLMNVAISRAKTQLIVVGHCEYIRTEYAGGLLDMLVSMFRERGDTIKVPATLRTEKLFESLWTCGARPAAST